MNKPTLEKFLGGSVLLLLAYMPFHLFLSRWLSLYTGGLGQWDAGKDILTIAALGVAIILALKRRLFKDKAIITIFVLSALYGLLHLLFIVFDRDDQHLRSFLVATLFNGRILAYLFIGMIVGRLRLISMRSVVRVMIIASTLTCLFALFQYLAPKDLMTNFGYSIERGVKPNFFIDDKVDFPRVMSTVRDPNSYGAYLIVPLTFLWLKLFRGQSKTRLLIGGLLLLHGLSLLLTFSRGAWIGAFISVSIATMLAYRQQLIDFIKKRYWILALPILILLVGGFYIRDTYVFKNVVLHSDESTVLADPNELRVQLQNKALADIASDPEGHGPGTAGLVSIGNPKGTFLTENYYLQIGYEIGIFGFLLFMALFIKIYKLIAGVISREYSMVFIGSFWAYAFLSMLIHLWSNETVAAQWWLLAGLVIGPALSNEHNSTSSNR